MKAECNCNFLIDKWQGGRLGVLDKRVEIISRGQVGLLAFSIIVDWGAPAYSARPLQK